ncbi:MAG: hypothetical protein JXQ73_28980 [Phycisphaerae bacterium]|nr:hypothetical protein [Phycisphaerae bacterium]
MITRARATGRHYVIAAAVILLCVCSPAEANAGSAMMLGRAMHLYFGNAVFGIVEGVLIAWLFKVRAGRAVLAMIIGNYVSMFAGQLALGGARAGFYETLLDGASIYEISDLHVRYFHGLFVLSLLLTFVIEWPFCLWALKRVAGRRFVKSLGADLLAQGVTYSVLVGMAAWGGSYQLVTEVRLDPSVVSEAGGDAKIYYLSPEGDLHRIRLDGQGDRMIAPLGLANNWVDLVLTQEVHGGPWALCLRERSEPRVLVPDLGMSVAPDCLDRRTETIGGREVAMIWNRGPYTHALDYRPPDRRDWEVKIWWWFGVLASNKKTGEQLKVALDTPLVTWRAEYGTVLPDNRVVFEMGDHLLLLDLNSRRLGAIAKGRRPIVVLRGAPAAAASQPSSSPSPAGS